MYSIMHLQGLSYSFCPAMQWGRLVIQLLEPAKVLGWLVGLPSDYFWLVDWWLVCLCVGRFVNWLVCWSIVCCLVDFVLLICLLISYFGNWLFLFLLHIAAKLVCILVGNWACLRVCWLLGYQLAGMMACELVAWVIGGPVLYLCDALFAW